MFVIGHRRSGNHFLIETLKLNYTLYGADVRGEDKLPRGVAYAQVKDWWVKKSHLMYQHVSERIAADDHAVYIVRDPRDMLTSCWWWWNTSGEARRSGIAAAIQHFTPSQYIRGEVEVSNITFKGGIIQKHIDGMILSDPVGRWIEHVRGYIGKIGIIRYEDLTLRPGIALEHARKALGLEPVERFRLLAKLVGHHPRKGVIGDHVNLFDPDDIAYIEERAGELMRELAYMEE